MIGLILALFLQGSQAPETPTPTVTEAEKLSVQLIVAKKDTAELKAKALKAEYEKNLAAVQADYSRLDAQFQAMLQQLILKYKIDPKLFGYNANTGGFDRLPEAKK